ncbi:MAG: phenylalanine--tRNA ligase subunit beta [Deltaproteobacteria bacterium]|nr:MAG: phenylalanine--tRNA ligase subunit beta [Deltaproteobacteria bacterium]
MKASYRWLRDLLPGLDAPADDVAERLTRSGLEVEEIIVYGAACTQVVIAEVRAVEPHPKRDKLTLVTVDRGTAEQIVVCGAPNVPAPGGRVVLAPLGTELPAIGFAVAAREIGGVVSEGMLCSENELGLVGGGGKGAGIMVLSPSVDGPLGTPLSEAIEGTHDVIFDIGVTPNRPDALSHVGLARELAALYDLDFSLPATETPSQVASDKAIAELASVEIADTERCPHYGAALIVDLTIGPSPDWLRYRLESLDMRAISNVVDVTNLVLLGYGQPLHAFDLDRLPGGRVLVRRAAAGEMMTTLDQIERKLSDDDLVITDGQRAIALAGVMGGADSEVGDDTKAVLLECAYFAPRGIRRTARRHGLHSEASHRFERGCDPEAVPDVLDRATALLANLCSGAAVPGAILAGVAPAKRQPIPLRKGRMASLLGLEIGLDRAGCILERLGFVVDGQGPRAEALTIVAPSFRPDIKREEDVIEEVMRVHGIDELPATARPVLPATGRSTPTTEDRARQAAAELGLAEALTYGFVSRAELEVLDAPAPCVTLKNPLTEDRSVMRSSLLPGLLEALKRARRHGVMDVRMFTVGRRFVAPVETEAVLPVERLGLAAVLAGSCSVGLSKPEPVTVYDAKGIAIEMIERVVGKPARLQREAPGAAGLKHLHPRGGAALYVGDQHVGCLGPLHPDVVERLDLDGECIVLEIDLHSLDEIGRTVPQYRPVPALPPVMRDLALVVSEDVSAGELSAVISQAAGELCESVELFDLFRGKGVPPDHQSLAYHLVFRDPKAATDLDHARTLTDKEVDACSRAVVKAVTSRFGATVRGR